MKRKNIASSIFICLFAALSGLALGCGLTCLCLVLFARAEKAFLNYALYALSAGILCGLLGVILALVRKSKNKPVSPLAGQFVSAHEEIETKDRFLLLSKKDKAQGIGAISYAIVSSLSEDERAILTPRINEIIYLRIRDFFPVDNSSVAFEKGFFYLSTSKGDLKAKLEETSKQILSSFVLDPTLPDIRLLLGADNNPETLEPSIRLAHAERACTYDAISRLSGALSLYDPAMEIDAKGIDFDLEGAIAEGRIEISYEPLLMKNNKTCAYRRVLRLFDPSRGLIEENELRRLVDNVGKGEQLDAYALTKTLDDLSVWDEGVRHKLKYVIISIGRSTFYRASFLQELRRTFNDRNLDLGRLCLAIGGEALYGDEAYCVNFAKKAHGLGIKVAILDFAARSPLTRIDELAPDLVSFAPSFAKQDERLGKAKIEVLKNTASTIDGGKSNFDTIPDLYPEKDVTASLALERLQNEEEFRR